MIESLLQQALARRNAGRPPVWFMRQAGRYHRHYQRLRARHDFMDLCKRPELAVEVTLGPIEDFGFDAAILFSDLLFPLEAMGMGLRYEPGPKLDWHLRSTADLARL
ncbi:MAG: uroporphyrinogen decarboxylase family protein, partial [Steroidobacteraceae bacterium]